MRTRGRGIGRVVVSARDETWKDFAVCRGIGPEHFFEDKPRGGPKTDRQRRDELKFIAKAKSLCSQCPVQARCLEYSMEHNLEKGIWGGMTEEERRQIRRSANVEVGVSRRRDTAGRYL